MTEEPIDSKPKRKKNFKLIINDKKELNPVYILLIGIGSLVLGFILYSNTDSFSLNYDSDKFTVALLAGGALAIVAALLKMAVRNK